MSSRFWATSEDLSTDSRWDESADVSGARTHDDSVEEIQTSGNYPQDGTVARHFAASTRASNLQPQQHASLFYLSLIEGRCRTQAARTINSGRQPDLHLPDDHSEVCQLAETLFSDVKRELIRGGMISEDIARRNLSELRQYLNSFDALLNNLAATTINHNITSDYGPSSLSIGRSSIFELASTSQFEQSGALMRRSSIMAAVQRPDGHIEPRVQRILDLFEPAGVSSQLEGHSRFAREFEELQKLGSGAFGTVYLARNKLDGGISAIKKINVRAENLQRLATTGKIERLLAEVTAMARLDHCNIAQYHHSWLEVDAGDAGPECDNSNNSLDNDGLFEREDSSNDGDVESESLEPNSKNALMNPKDTQDIRRQINFNGCLYIKMKLYPTTLETYLKIPGGSPSESQDDKKPKARHCFHSKPTARLLLAIVDGLEHLHEQGYVHHDLKPGNIFLAMAGPTVKKPREGFFDVKDCQDCSSGLVAKDNLESTSTTPGTAFICPCIGDFGLAQELEKINEEKGLTAGNYTQEPIGTSTVLPGNVWGVGTKSYLPPRIPKIGKKICPKLDVYSLGIIATELCCQFSSMTERLEVLNDIRGGDLKGAPVGSPIFPSIVKEGPFFELIEGMLRHDRDERWGCEQVRVWLESHLLNLKTEAMSL